MVSQQYRALSNCTDVQAGLALYWWQKLITFGVGRIRVNIFYLYRWQYFGSTAGIVRIYPGREWSTNFAGFYNDYDPRVRPWYIAATSGPKDVIIIIDCR